LTIRTQPGRAVLQDNKPLMGFSGKDMTIWTVDEEIAENSSLQVRPPFFLMTVLSLLIHALFLGILFMASENPFLRETDARKLSIIPIHLSPSVEHHADRKASPRQSPIRRMIGKTHDMPEEKEKKPIHTVNSQIQTPAPIGKASMRDISRTVGGEQLPSTHENQTKIVALTSEGLLPAASGGARIYSLNKAEASFDKPRYTQTPCPVYPRTARNRGQEGVVLLSVEVLDNGRTGQILVKKSSGYALLDRAALDAVRFWRFEPAKRSQIPLTMLVDIPIRFSLQEDN